MFTYYVRSANRVVRPGERSGCGWMVGRWGVAAWRGMGRDGAEQSGSNEAPVEKSSAGMLRDVPRDGQLQRTVER